MRASLELPAQLCVGRDLPGPERWPLQGNRELPGAGSKEPGVEQGAHTAGSPADIQTGPELSRPRQYRAAVP